MQETVGRLNDFLVNLAAGFTQVAVIFIFNRVLLILRRHTRVPRINDLLRDRRAVVATQVAIMLMIGIGVMVLAGTALSVKGRLVLLILTSLSCIGVFVKELWRFWSIGICSVDSSIAGDTYQRTMNLAQTSFSLLGTNLHSVASSTAFEGMLKRIRESRGAVELLLAHPESNALLEAARNRGCEQELYRTQARMSLGNVLKLRNNLGIGIYVRVYEAESIEDLPIFRAMFVNGCYCVASIAVYGRSDHGRAMPQLHVKRDSTGSDSQRNLYSVLHRYYRGLWDRSRDLSADEEGRYIEYANSASAIILAIRT